MDYDELTTEQKRAIVDYVTSTSPKSILGNCEEFEDVEGVDRDDYYEAIRSFLEAIKETIETMI